MLVYLKTTAGVSVETDKGVLELKGFGILNDVSNEMWDLAKKDSAIQDMLENGYIVESTSKSDNSQADTMGAVKSKQDKTKNAKVVKE